MLFDNLAVMHKSFGAGHVVSKNGKYITVKFDKLQKIFVYPDVFENYMTLTDGTLSPEILADIEAERTARERIRAEKEEENLRAMRKGIVIPGKEILPEADEDEEHKSSQEEF